MMSNTVAVDNMLSVSETHDAGTRSTSSRAKSRTERGQVFADSPALAKVKAEGKSDMETQAGNENSAESKSDGEADTSPASEESPVAKPVEKEVPAVTHSRNPRRSNEPTPSGSRPKAQALTVERVVALGVDQHVQVQPVAGQAATQPVHAQTSAGLQAQEDQSQVCPVPIITPVQDASVQVAGSELSQPGQTLAGCRPATTPTMVDDVTKAQGSAGGPDSASSVAKNATTEVAVPQGDAAAVSDSSPQEPATETAVIEAPALNLTAAEVSDKGQVAPKEQLPVQGPKQVPPVQTNPQVEAQAGPEQSRGDSPQAPVQAGAGASRPAPMESLAAMLSPGKGDLEVTQKGQDSQPDLSGVSPDMPATASSRVLTDAATTPTSEAAAMKNPSQDFTQQLGGALRASLDRPDKQLVVRLQPPELGSVLIRFEEQGQQIKAVLEVSRLETGREIEQALPQVIKNLQEAGLQIRKFDVVVSDQLGKDAGGNSSSHDAWNQQQAWSGTGNRSDGEPRPAWSPWNGHQTQPDSSRVHDSQDVSSQSGIDLLA